MKKCLLFLLLVLPLQLDAGSRLLKQSTATTRNIHLVKDTAPATGLTGATVGSITAFVKKHSDSLSSTKTDLSTGASAANECTEVAQGLYNCKLTTANTDTLGDLQLCYSYTNAVTTCDEYLVVSSSVYDSQVTSIASISDMLNQACSVAVVTSSWGYKLCTNLDAPITEYSIIQNKTTINTLASQTSFTLVDGPAGDSFKGWEILIKSASSPQLMALGVVESYTGSTKTITLANDPAVYTMAPGDLVYLLPSKSLKPTIDNRRLDVAANGGAGIDWANIKAPTTTVNLSGTTIGGVGNVTGSVGSVTAAVTLPTIPANWITSSGIQAGAFTFAKFNVDVPNGFSANFLATTYEGSESIKDWYRGARASLWGKYNLSGNIYNFRSANDAKTRLAIQTTSTPPARTNVVVDYSD